MVNGISMLSSSAMIYYNFKYSGNIIMNYFRIINFSLSIYIFFLNFDIGFLTRKIIASQGLNFNSRGKPPMR